MQSLRTLAGFSATIGDYYLSRDSVKPNEKLLNLVYPLDDIKLQMEEHNEVPQSSQNFLSFMKLSATCLLQDAVVLMDKPFFKDLYIWKHPLFKSEEFTSFARELKGVMTDKLPPGELLLKQCLPAIHSNFERNLNVNMDMHRKTHTQMQEMNSSQIKLLTSLADIANGNLAGSMLKGIGHAFQLAAEAASEELSESESSNESEDSNSAGTEERPSKRTKIQEKSKILEYTLSQRLKTVADVWREYTCGLGGYPPVKEIEKEYGTGWRKSNTATQQWTRRKSIYNEVNYYIKEKNLSESSAVAKVEELRGDLSLFKLHGKLRKIQVMRDTTKKNRQASA